MVEQFEALLTPVLTQAYATARHLTRGDGDAAENLVQEAALRAFRAFHTFQGGTNFRAWFLRIVTNLYLEQYRRAKRAPVTVSVDETRLPGLADHCIVHSTHTGLLFSRDAVGQAAHFLRHGRFEHAAEQSDV